MLELRAARHVGYLVVELLEEGIGETAHEGDERRNAASSGLVWQGERETGKQHEQGNDKKKKIGEQYLCINSCIAFAQVPCVHIVPFMCKILFCAVKFSDSENQIQVQHQNKMFLDKTFSTQ